MSNVDVSNGSQNAVPSAIEAQPTPPETTPDPQALDPQAPDPQVPDSQAPNLAPRPAESSDSNREARPANRRNTSRSRSKSSKAAASKATSSQTKASKTAANKTTAGANQISESPAPPPRETGNRAPSEADPPRSMSSSPAKTASDPSLPPAQPIPASADLDPKIDSTANPTPEPDTNANPGSSNSRVSRKPTSKNETQPAGSKTKPPKTQPPKDQSVAPIATDRRLREVVHGAIQQHFRKTIKCRKAVLKDLDPEPLHQMRVGLRRLRSTLHTFGAVVNIPKPGRDPALAYLGRRLGKVRDLDVLHVDLSRRTLPELPMKEQKRLEGVLRQIQQQRTQYFRSLEVMLGGDRYKSFKRAYRTWLDDPQYTALGDLPWTTEAPDLLLSLFCGLFRHPGWLLGTQVQGQQLQTLPWEDYGPAITATLQDPDCCEQLHHLRKTVKRVRYQSELFQPFYGAALDDIIQDLKQAQEVLGHLQDLQIQRDTIDGYLNKSIASHLPTVVAQFEATQGQLWQQWQPLQQHYLDASYRHHIRQLLIQPGTASRSVSSVTEG
ncbi:MAG: CHAD domain-containing protein [Prochlorothrix sp.]|nr:CHAD domain-containing protein [Prochlorothrix sp.]